MKKLILTTMALMFFAFPAMAQETKADAATQNGEIQYTLRIDGISCPFCVATSEKALKDIDGVREVDSDLKEGTITVCANKEKVAFTDEQLTDLFKQKGFTYRDMEKAEQCQAL